MAEHTQDWDLLITGHSLGGALATLFAADVGEFGIDAGRGLPTLAPSEPWWGRVLGNVETALTARDVPRPRAMQLYTFGSPRVGNEIFAQLFTTLPLQAVYRVVNGSDVVARVPRSMNALWAQVRVLGSPTVQAMALAGPPQANRDKASCVRG